MQNIIPSKKPKHEMLPSVLEQVPYPINIDCMCEF